MPLGCWAHLLGLLSKVSVSLNTSLDAIGYHARGKLGLNQYQRAPADAAPRGSLKARPLRPV
jgi:hypothetical protein